MRRTPRHLQTPIRTGSQPPVHAPEDPPDPGGSNRIYAIADIHGYDDELALAHDRIAADRERTGDDAAPVVHLGDLVDRGPNAAGVIARLVSGIEAGAPWIVLKGNHDRLFAGFLHDPDWSDPALPRGLDWSDGRLGGVETLASYGVQKSVFRSRRSLHREAVAAVPVAHQIFLRDLPTHHITDDLIFVHAGIRPGVPIAAQTETDLLWIRDGFLEDRRDHGRLVVHGHTVEDVPRHFGNRVALDAGAGYGRPLVAAVFEGREVAILTGGERRWLPPEM